MLCAIADDELLLRSERALDPPSEPGYETWDRVRAAGRSGRIAHRPLPVRTLHARTSNAAVVDDDAQLGIAYRVHTAARVRWEALRGRPLAGEPHPIWLQAHQPEAFTETVIRSGLVEIGEALPDRVRAVKLIGGREDGEVSAKAAHAAACVLQIRHHELELGFEPAHPGECPHIRHELIQSAGRPETAERFTLMSRALKALASRPEHYPMVYARVHLSAPAVLKRQGEC